MKKYRQYIKHALLNLTASKLRSFLAILGILVGTASVVTLISSAELATAKALEQFRALGTDLLAMSVYPAKYSSDLTPENTLSLDQITDLQDSLPEIKAIAPYTSLFLSVSYHGKKLEGNVIGATEHIKNAIKLKVDKGNFVSYYNHYHRYAFIGQDIYNQIKKDFSEDPLGQQIWLGQNVYTIIGVAEHWHENTFFNSNANRSVFIPIENSTIIDKNSRISNMIIILNGEPNIEKLKSKLEAFVQKHAPELKVFIRSPAQIIESMEKQSRIFTLLLSLIGGISLLVGGIGVMNIMLVSVAERRREIGIIKAVGAKRKDIVALFLTEAVILSLFGGALGVIIGIILSNIISYFTQWGFAIYLLPPAIGFLVSFCTGVFFGIYPAYRAAALNPIQALRYD